MQLLALNPSFLQGTDVLQKAEQSPGPSEDKGDKLMVQGEASRHPGQRFL